MGFAVVVVYYDVFVSGRVCYCMSVFFSSFVLCKRPELESRTAYSFFIRH